VRIHFTLPLAPSKNHSHVTYIDKKTKRQRRGPTTKTKKWTMDAQSVAGIEARACGWTCTQKQEVEIMLVVYFPDHRRRDAHNQEMVLFDALQGVIYDDDCYIIEHTTRKMYDKDSPRMEVTVTRT